MADSEWSQQEIDASVEAYMQMLSKELKAEKYNKAAVNRKLREGELFERSRGSLEMRMCNISAVLGAKGLRYIEGYKPRSNVGTRVTTMIEESIQRFKDANLGAGGFFEEKDEPDFLTDLSRAEENGDFEGVDNTERETLQKSRVGQGKFRQSLIDKWGCCAVTEVDDAALLVASHIKPWKDCSNAERLDPYNGFLLLPHLDHLFDKGYLSFEDTGGILISSDLSQAAQENMSISDDLVLAKFHPNNRAFLTFHRENVYRD
ncbi:HNH endonuclease [Akkermansiaceae bacterium]|nr:HNH endonuclease [Akkermansiaceae bacterium]